MIVINILRLIRKHIVLLMATPVALAIIVVLLTKNPDYSYTSETTLYTGIASGSGIEMDKAANYFVANTAFDNLINIIKSRETKQEVALRLLSQHLMLDAPDPKYISAASFIEFRKIVPAYIYKLVVKEAATPDEILSGEASLQALTSISDTLTNSFSFRDLYDDEKLKYIPPTINPEAFEQTYENLKAYMATSDTNFVYELLNYDHHHYSIKAVSKVNVQRIGTSDLMRLRFDSDDPGICQQTLFFFTDACIKNFKFLRENRSDAVVRYFEHQLRLAANRLQIGEDKLLKFNMDNNIINYYEQSKAIAIVKEELDIEYNKMRISLAGNLAAISRIEEKLASQQQIHLKSSAIVQKRNELGVINEQISTAELTRFGSGISDTTLVTLKTRAEKIKDEIRENVSQLYNLGNTIEGLPVSKLLNDWITNVIEFEDTKAGMQVLAERITEFQKQYEIYAPAGANIKRIEREINVSEQEFLEILHGLNLARLKLQDIELSSNIKAVDPPFFPLSPNPAKRKIMVLVAAMFGFLMVLTTILAMEYFDDTLRDPTRAEKVLKLRQAGIFPKIYLKTGTLNFPFVTNRLLEMALQNIGFYRPENSAKEPHTILIFSMLGREGKTTAAGNIAHKMKKQGKKVLFLTYNRESLKEAEISQFGYSEANTNPTIPPGRKKRQPYPIFSRLLGYSDTRIDFDSPFLSTPASFLNTEEYMEYEINEAYFSADNFRELILESTKFSRPDPDFVIIELPPVLYYQYSAPLMEKAGTSILVCRANRTWSGADEGMLEIIRKQTTQEPYFFLNGVEIPILEMVLGDLPKKRSRLRRLVKNLARLQFYQRQEI
jgi:polysaccharide biosynthesis transport protein